MANKLTLVRCNIFVDILMQLVLFYVEQMFK